MAMAKVLKTCDKKGFVSSNTGGSSEDSPRYPSEQNAYFLDPWTGEEVEEADPATLVSKLTNGEYENVNLMTKDFLLNLQRNNLAHGQIKRDPEPDAKIMEHLVIYLGSFKEEDRPRVREIIIDEISNPNYVVRKDQGAGKKPTFQINMGKKQVLAWGIHKGQRSNDGGTVEDHFHLFVSVHTLTDKFYLWDTNRNIATSPSGEKGNKRMIIAANSVNDNQVQIAIETQINSRLKAEHIEGTFSLGTPQKKIKTGADKRAENIQNKGENSNKPLSETAKENFNLDTLPEEELAALTQPGNLNAPEHDFNLQKLEEIINRTAYSSSDAATRKRKALEEKLTEVAVLEQELQAINAGIVYRAKFEKAESEKKEKDEIINNQKEVISEKEVIISEKEEVINSQATVIDNNNKEIDTLTQSVAKHAAEKAEVQEKLNTALGQIENLYLDLQESDNLLEIEKNINSVLSEEKSVLEQEKSALEKDKANLETSVKNLTTDLKNSVEKVAELERQREELIQSHASEITDLNSLHAEEIIKAKEQARISERQDFTNTLISLRKTLNAHRNYRQKDVPALIAEAKSSAVREFKFKELPDRLKKAKEDAVEKYESKVSEKIKKITDNEQIINKGVDGLIELVKTEEKKSAKLQKDFDTAIDLSTKNMEKLDKEIERLKSILESNGINPDPKKPKNK